MRLFDAIPRLAPQMKVPLSILPLFVVDCGLEIADN
jgi:hypothetical protein